MLLIDDMLRPLIETGAILQLSPLGEIASPCSNAKAWHPPLSTGSRTALAPCLREIGRVLKSRGRLLVVDFGEAELPGHILPAFHRHGYVRFEDVLELLTSVGFRIERSGAVGFRSLQFAVATLASSD
jgi:hypothetical protein